MPLAAAVYLDPNRPFGPAEFEVSFQSAGVAIGNQARSATAFALDMTVPGVEVRPLRQMNGDSHFNEVFLTDAVVAERPRIRPHVDGFRGVQQNAKGLMIRAVLQHLRLVVLLGGHPEWRMGFTTDNGNVVLHVHGLDIADPRALETRINQIAGVVTVGLFAHRGADVILVGGPEGVKTLTPAA